MPDLSWRGIDKRTKPWHKRRLRGPTRERDDAGRFDRSPRPQPRSWLVRSSARVEPGESLKGTLADAGMGEGRISWGQSVATEPSDQTTSRCRLSAVA
jgi:hypothetical protein